MIDHCNLTANEDLLLLSNGKLTVGIYAKSFLGRIQKRDLIVKAWEFLDPEFVLKQANKLDEIPVEKEDRCMVSLSELEMSP